MVTAWPRAPLVASEQEPWAEPTDWELREEMPSWWMVQWVKSLTTRPEDLGLIPEPVWCKD